MGDIFRFLTYFVLFYGLIVAALFCLLILFFLNFSSFHNFLCSKSFWIAWLLPYLLLFIIVCINITFPLWPLFISGLSLPLVYFLRKAFIRKHSNLVPNKLSSWIIWAIPMSICSFLFILVYMFGLYIIIYLSVSFRQII